ncbi:hypothetical protein IID62_03240, partial [candidate division KSB1 bacterium]|nr:hypothetical protein [candidate division KSB1 bacterium]
MHKRLEEDNVKPATVNREAEFLKSLFTKAVDWGFLHTNQLRGMKLFKETNKRNVKLTLEQVKALVDILPETISDIVECAIYTGFRKENLLSLRIENIEFDDSGTGKVVCVKTGTLTGHNDFVEFTVISGTITAVNDDIAEGNHKSVLKHTAKSKDDNYGGISINNVSVSITDDDT